MRILGLLLALSVMLPVYATAPAQPVLEFRQALGSPASRYSQSLLTEAYQRLGVEARFIEVPLGRSLIESDKGNLAGELARVLHINQQYKNLLPVPYVLFDTHVYLYVNQQRCAGCQLSQVQSLAYVRGTLIVEELLRKLPASRQVIGSGSLDAAKQMFLTGKVDGVLFPAYKLNATSSFPISEQILQSLPDYHFLHRQHQELIPRLTQMLFQLEREGFAERLRLKYGVPAPRRQLSRNEKPFAEY